MFRFPYRRVWADRRPVIGSPPLGLLSRLIRLLTGKLAATQQPPTTVSDNAPRPVVSIRIRGPVAAVVSSPRSWTPGRRTRFSPRRSRSRSVSYLGAKGRRSDGEDNGTGLSFTRSSLNSRRSYSRGVGKPDLDSPLHRSPTHYSAIEAAWSFWTQSSPGRVKLSRST